MTFRRYSRTGIATIGCAALLLPACEGVDCRETETDAHDAALADTGDAGSSAVLEARLTSGSRPVAGRSVEFYVRDGNEPLEFAGSAVTDSDGFARLDLKEDPVELAQDAAADSFRAAFHGDARFCSSRGEAPIDLVTVP